MVEPTVLLAPPLYLVLSLLSLHLFKGAYSVLALAADARGAHARFAAVRAVAPLLKQLLRFAEGALGPAERLQFNVTHVCLVALIVAVVVQAGETRAELRRRSR
jgi:hypothetical protein